MASDNDMAELERLEQELADLEADEPPKPKKKKRKKKKKKKGLLRFFEPDDDKGSYKDEGKGVIEDIMKRKKYMRGIE